MAPEVKILLVDDQPASLLALEAVLEPLAQPLVRAGSGEEALRLLLKDGPFAVVLMDVRLPGITGPETVRLMKQSERTRNVPVIVLTAYPDEEERQEQEMYATGAVDFLLKPFDPEVLRAKVTVFVELFREREQMRAQEGAAARAEAEAQRTLLAPIIEHSLDAILITDSEGQVRNANPEAQRLLGHPLVGQLAPGWTRQLEMTDASGRPLDLEDTPIQQALAGRAIREQRLWIRHPDGTRHALSVTCTPLVRADGSIGGAVWVAREETARLLLEEERNQTLALLDALLAAAPVGLAFYDRWLRCVRTNHTMAAIHGRTAGEHLGRPIAEILPPPLVEQTETLLRQVLASGEPVLGLDVSLEPESSDAEPRHFVASYYPVVAPPGTVGGVGEVLVEITDRKRYELHLQRTAEFRERFLGAVGHDLRNPLNAILFAAQSLASRPLGPEQTARAAQRIRTSAERMSQMISELLDFTRGRLGGGVPVKRQSVDLAALSREVLDELRLAHPGRAVELRADDEVLGSWDAVRLAQVLSNLVSNALRYGGQTTPVIVTVTGRAGQGVLEVHNGGPPISETLLPHLFEPFQRGEQVNRSSGLGLGLYIVQQIVQSHGGTVEVASSEEAGTTFTVQLPLEGNETAEPEIHA